MHSMRSLYIGIKVFFWYWGKFCDLDTLTYITYIYIYYIDVFIFKFNCSLIKSDFDVGVVSPRAADRHGGKIDLGSML
jgi:hypothetical protein